MEPDSIDAYIEAQPAAVRGRLQELREVIRAAAPDASEKISYRIPTFDHHGPLVHFAAFANHIGFYPTPSGIEAFAHELEGYTHAKGSVQFPLTEPLPLELVERIVRFRVSENEEKKARKDEARKAKKDEARKGKGAAGTKGVAGSTKRPRR